jgi:hypothetical protein
MARSVVGAGVRAEVHAGVRFGHAHHRLEVAHGDW